MLNRYMDKTQTGVNGASASVTYANSSTIDVKNARDAYAIFTRTNHSAGSGLFEVYGSADGTNYFALPLVSLSANTNAQNLTRVVSASLASNTVVMYKIEETFLRSLRYIKAQYTKTTDGNGTVEFSICDDVVSGMA